MASENDSPFTMRWQRSWLTVRCALPSSPWFARQPRAWPSVMPASSRSASSLVKSSTSASVIASAAPPIFMFQMLPPFVDFFAAAAPPPASETESGVWPSRRTAARAPRRSAAWTVLSTRRPSFVIAL